MKITVQNLSSSVLFLPHPLSLSLTGNEHRELSVRPEDMAEINKHPDIQRAIRKRVLEVKPVEPEVEAEEPEVKPVEPEVESEEPEVKPVEPEVESKEPEVKPVEPEVESKEPEVKPVEPEVESKEPEAKEPEAKARKPRRGHKSKKTK